ncbi:MAG: hypothetical protein AAGF77_01865 [Bacteroidota bacterium]
MSYASHKYQEETYVKSNFGKLLTAQKAGTVAVVYSDKTTEEHYKSLITKAAQQLKHRFSLAFLDLEDLPGAEGLKAIRISI